MSIGVEDFLYEKGSSFVVRVFFFIVFEDIGFFGYCRWVFGLFFVVSSYMKDIIFCFIFFFIKELRRFCVFVLIFCRLERNFSVEFIYEWVDD